MDDNRKYMYYYEAGCDGDIVIYGSFISTEEDVLSEIDSISKHIKEKHDPDEVEVLVVFKSFLMKTKSLISVDEYNSSFSEYKIIDYGGFVNTMIAIDDNKEKITGVR